MLTVVSGSARKQCKNAWCAMNFVCVVVSDLEAEDVQQCKHRHTHKEGHILIRRLR